MLAIIITENNAQGMHFLPLVRRFSTNTLDPWSGPFISFFTPEPAPCAPPDRNFQLASHSAVGAEWKGIMPPTLARTLKHFRIEGSCYVFNPRRNVMQILSHRRASD